MVRFIVLKLVLHLFQIKHIDKLVQSVDEEFRDIQTSDLRRRMTSFGWTSEDMEIILHPMISSQKEAVGSMGDDTPIAVLSDNYRGLHHFFRQNFSQVTNPPIDSLRERVVMSLRTRIGNLSNILDEDQSQCDHLQLNSPVLSINQFKTLRQYMKDKVKIIDTTMDIQKENYHFKKELDSDLQVSLYASKIDISEVLRRRLYDKNVNFILTSATIKVERLSVAPSALL